ncbi:YcnI family protein [Georgenia ruanii]|uniref:DUF1775 domain-containing protein n=1 Tax=Georgenia ruanii TaxID=348442 RepID=A0A7J9UY85_9MICO|nr:YcnI family protein [Georgenia ruanii]MPV89597.1 DUF1775 domain-containing protein [Georgenia ruanii]
MLGRTGAVLTLVVGLTGAGAALAGPASAHVSVNSDGEASQGGYEKLTFRVPNESDTAGTVKLEVTVPTDTPLVSARTQPVPGWDAVVTREQLPQPVEMGDLTIKEAVTAITWTAQPGVRIEPGQFQEFAISTGPLPLVDELVVPATQTYDDGTVVAWDQAAVDGKEPERPAPAVALAADGAHEHGVSAPDDGAAAQPGSDPAARALGIAGLVVGAAGLVAAVLALGGRRRA